MADNGNDTIKNLKDSIKGWYEDHPDVAHTLTGAGLGGLLYTLLMGKDTTGLGVAGSAGLGGGLGYLYDVGKDTAESSIKRETIDEIIKEHGTDSDKIISELKKLGAGKPDVDYAIAKLDKEYSPDWKRSSLSIPRAAGSIALGTASYPIERGINSLRAAGRSRGVKLSPDAAKSRPLSKRFLSKHPKTSFGVRSAIPYAILGLVDYGMDWLGERGTDKVQENLGDFRSEIGSYNNE